MALHDATIATLVNTEHCPIAVNFMVSPCFMVMQLNHQLISTN